MTTMLRIGRANHTGHYLADISGQPGSLRELAGRIGRDHALRPVIEAWKAAGQPPVLLTGMGASLYAAQGIAERFATGSFPLQVVPTCRLLERPGQLGDSLVIAISQSGRSVEIAELLEVVSRDRLVAVTNRGDNPLARSAIANVQLEVLPDESVAIKTYTATVAALALVVAALSRGSTAKVAAEVADAAGQIHSKLDRWGEVASEAALALRDARATYVLGWGAGLATAREAALILKEGARTPAEAMHADEFRHGSVEVVDERIAVIVFATTSVARSDPRAAVAELARLTQRIVVVGGDASFSTVPGVVHMATIEHERLASLITDVVPIQLMAAHMAFSAGYAAGEFRNTTPVISERPSGQLVSTSRP